MTVALDEPLSRHKLVVGPVHHDLGHARERPFKT